ncbi:MAG: inositol monophosphatase [Pseudomonadota bacterium]
MDARPGAPSQETGSELDVRDAALVADAVEAAGDVALSFFRNNAKHWDKDDGSPVTEADLAVDEKLHEFLGTARPHYGFLSEEKGRTGEADRTFVIDPIDGTRGFMTGDPVWAIVVAVVENGRPVAAAIREPVLGVTYTAFRGGGAFLNGRLIAVRGGDADLDPIKGALIACPMSIFRDARLKHEGATRAPVLPSLALRLARVADGRFSGCIAKSGAHHWDLAAADLLVSEAGGTLLSLTGEHLRYDTAETRHGPIVSAAEGLAAKLRSLAGRAFPVPAQ